MRSLFWRLFFSFWFAQAIVLALAILFANLGFWRAQIQSLDQLRERAPAIAQQAVQVFEAEGDSGLTRYIDSESDTLGARFWLFDSRGNELSGNPYTAAVASAVRSAEPTHSKDNVVVLPIQGAQAGYMFAAQLRPRRSPRPPLRVIVRQLLLGFLVSGVICFLLAHSLTRPVVQLRGAAQELATGNLRARAGEAVARRADEIGQLGRDFDRMAGQIEALVGNQKQLLRDISHDLRSPLQRIRAALELARRADASQQAQFDRIERETVRINSFIEQLLTLARLDSAEATPALHPISLNEIVERVVSDARLEAERAGCTVTLSALASYVVNGNAEALISAIENVVRNAIHHGGEGKLIEIGLHGEGDDVVLTVRDHGRGVPEEVLPRLFEPFYRVDQARSTSTGGAGLGLAIASRSVGLHGGTITAQNASPSGLLITIRLPLLRGEKNAS
jgi:signal transduction histidine kinase